MNRAGMLSSPLAAMLFSPLAGEERDLATQELSRSGEGVFGVSHALPTAPSQDLLGSLRSPSQVYLSREGREGNS